MTKTAVFAGPSLYQRDTHHFSIFPPCRLGSVYWATQEGFSRIVIIDGYFGVLASVWHKEILFALSQGVEVWGGGSMGALRAAELSEFGMSGFGKVFRLFQAGVLNDDDEVCVVHVAGKDYRPITESMVNIRLNIRRLCRRIGIDKTTSSALIQMCKMLHFSDRTHDSIRSVFKNVFGTSQYTSMWNYYTQFAIDQKSDDSERLLSLLRQGTLKFSKKSSWVFPNTLFWRRQFEEQLLDLPPGNLDPYLLS